jgi:hypothetical protein
MEHGAGVAFTEEANSLSVDLGRVCFKDQRSTEHVEDGPKNTRSARASARPASGREGGRQGGRESILQPQIRTGLLHAPRGQALDDIEHASSIGLHRLKGDPRVGVWRPLSRFIIHEGTGARRHIWAAWRGRLPEMAAGIGVHAKCSLAVYWSEAERASGALAGHSDSPSTGGRRPAGPPTRPHAGPPAREVLVGSFPGIPHQKTLARAQTLRLCHILPSPPKSNAAF